MYLDISTPPTISVATPPAAAALVSTAAAQQELLASVLNVVINSVYVLQALKRPSKACQYNTHDDAAKDGLPAYVPTGICRRREVY
jgi:hypothetical protein